MTLHESGEMYLETVYILSQKSSAVRAIDVGEYMGFSKPSVSRAVGILKKDGLLRTDEQGYLKLTESGETKAKIINERHKLLSLYTAFEHTDGHRNAQAGHDDVHNGENSIPEEVDSSRFPLFLSCFSNYEETPYSQ